MFTQATFTEFPDMHDIFDLHYSDCSKSCYSEGDTDFGYKVKITNNGGTKTKECTKNELVPCNLKLLTTENTEITELYVGLEVVVGEKWSDELTDNTSEEFRTIAEIYEIILMAQLMEKYAYSTTGSQYNIKSIEVTILNMIFDLWVKQRQHTTEKII